MAFKYDLQLFYDQQDNARKESEEMGWSEKLGRCSRGMPKPKIMRIDDGISEQLEESKGLGNAIVPQIAELLFRRIKEIINV